MTLLVVDSHIVKHSCFPVYVAHPQDRIDTHHEGIIFSHQAHEVLELIYFHTCLLCTSVHDPPVPKITTDIPLEVQVITAFDLMVSRFSSVRFLTTFLKL